MNSTKVIVRDFKLPARIGIYPREHTDPQDICVNITMELSGFNIGDDTIDNTVSYENIIGEVRRLSHIHHNLVETLAENLALFALKENRITSVEIEIEKITAFPEGHVGCIIRRDQKI